MTFDDEPALATPVRGMFQGLRHRTAALRLESGPIERQGRGIKECQEFLRPLFGLFLLLALVFSVGEGDKIEGSCAKKKFVLRLFDNYFLTLQRRSIRFQYFERYLSHSLIWDVAVHHALSKS